MIFKEQHPTTKDVWPDCKVEVMENNSPVEHHYNNIINMEPLHLFMQPAFSSLYLLFFLYRLQHGDTTVEGANLSCFFGDEPMTKCVQLLISV